MIITKQLSIDLVRRGAIRFVEAVQCDANTRAVAVTLTAAGMPWKPPAGVTASVAFKKPDGKKGWYDKLPNGSPACSVSGNVVTAILAPEVLTAAGRVDAVIVFQDGSMNQLATFSFVIDVEKNPAAGSVISNDYYDLSGAGVGRSTRDGGEIFNDYGANQALSPYSKADGVGSRAGCYGYKPLSTTADGTITVEDADLTGNRAIDNYEVGDLICFDGQFHWYHELKISALATNTAGNTVITVVTVNGGDMADLTMDGSGNEFEDWVYVPSKPTAGIAGPFSYAAYAGGEGSVAIGRGARATGRNSQAIGNYATAIGRDSVAGYSAYAEGVGTVATGFHSHAEGLGTIASGARSHSEGDRTKAEGVISHAEGKSTIARGDYSHAEGYETIANGIGSHAGGFRTTANGAHSYAEGKNTTAGGVISHAEGEYTIANGDYSHAEGNGSVASGNYSHAEGQDTTAVGNHSHTEGVGTNAEGACSHAEGTKTTANGEASHAEGNGTIASSEASHAEGYTTSASGIGSHAEGFSAIASGEVSHAEGRGTEASGDYSHAEGYSTIASGLQAHAEGKNTRAKGKSSHAEGTDTTASGGHSHAEGSGTTASGGYAHAEGYSTTASAVAAHAEGIDTIASGGRSHAEGTGTIAAGLNQHAQGKFNIEDTENKYAHIIGGGISEGDRKNIHTVDWDGNGFFNESVEAAAVILRSTTAGSRKRFKLTVDDSGTLTVTEV